MQEWPRGVINSHWTLVGVRVDTRYVTTDKHQALCDPLHEWLKHTLHPINCLNLLSDEHVQLHGGKEENGEGQSLRNIACMGENSSLGFIETVHQL